MSQTKIDTRPDGHCYLCGTPITVGRRRTREKSYTASEIRGMVERADAEVDVWLACHADDSTEPGPGIAEGADRYRAALLAQLDTGNQGGERG